MGKESIFTSDYCYAATCANHNILADFSECLTAVQKTGEYQKIRDQWLSAYEPPATAMQILMTALWIVVPLAGLLCLSVAWSRILSRRVRAATAKIIASEERLRLAMEATSDGVWDWNVRTGAFYCSPRCYTMLGYEADAFPMTHDRWAEYLHPNDRESVMASVRSQMARGNGSFSIECRFRMKDGGYKWILSRGSAVERVADGTITRMAGTHVDISEHKAVEAEQRITARLLACFNQPGSLHDIIRNVVTLIQEWSGCEAVGLRLHQGDDYPYFEANGFPPEFVQLEKSLCARDCGGQPLRDETGAPVIECMCGNVICGRFDPDKPFFTGFGSFWSNGTTQLLASTTDADRQTRTRNRCNGAGYESVALIPLKTSTGNIGLLQMNDRRTNRFTPEMIAQAERLASGVALAISQRYAQEAFRENEAFIRTIIDHLPIGIAVITTTPSPQIKYMNDQFPLCYRTTRAALTSPDALWEAAFEDPATREQMRTRITEDCALGEPDRMQWNDIPITRKNAEPRFVSARNINLPSGGMTISMVWDVTDRKQLEDRLRQREKMDAIGQLAGGVAHDFNNQLGCIMGYAEMLLRAVTEPLQRQYADNIFKASNRAAELTRQLLAFSRKGKFLDTVVNLHDTISEVSTLLQRSIDKRITVTLRLEAEPATVRGDPTQLQNAFLNLALNARDAMPHGGELIFATRIIEVEAHTQDIELAPGVYVETCVSDTGIGMSAEVKRHLFEPFFTTKEQGKGTGLGLASVFGTVRNHHGTVTAYSEPGHGSTFKVYLPAVEAEEAPRRSKTAIRPVRRNIRIMVVDDEAVFCELACELLTGLGYDPIGFTDPRKALEYYGKYKQNINLVLLDLVMPHMSGDELFEKLKEINPDVRALLSSGFGLNGEAQGVLNKGVRGYLQKPYRQEDLLRLISDAMHE